MMLTVMRLIGFLYVALVAMNVLAIFTGATYSL